VWQGQVERVVQLRCRFHRHCLDIVGRELGRDCRHDLECQLLHRGWSDLRLIGQRDVGGLRLDRLEWQQRREHRGRLLQRRHLHRRQL
jgi:hypothetical protein